MTSNRATLSGFGGALASALLVMACASSAGAPPSAAAGPNAKHEADAGMTTISTRTSMVAEAARRILASAPKEGPYPLFFSVGEGEAIGRVADELRGVVAADPRVVFSKAESRHAPPLADPSVSTGHVHAVETRLVPKPAFVVRLSESSGVLYVALRDGSDALAPPVNGWLWTLEAR